MPLPTTAFPKCRPSLDFGFEVTWPDQGGQRGPRSGCRRPSGADTKGAREFILASAGYHRLTQRADQALPTGLSAEPRHGGGLGRNWPWQLGRKELRHLALSHRAQSEHPGCARPAGQSGRARSRPYLQLGALPEQRLPDAGRQRQGRGRRSTGLFAGIGQRRRAGNKQPSRVTAGARLIARIRCTRNLATFNESNNVSPLALWCAFYFHSGEQ